jgi:hypothetical protein
MVSPHQLRHQLTNEAGAIINLEIRMVQAGSSRHLLPGTTLNSLYKTSTAAHSYPVECRVRRKITTTDNAINKVGTVVMC